MATIRKCRKCRNEFPLSALKQSSMGLVCKDGTDCTWHCGGKTRTKKKPEVIETKEVQPELPIADYEINPDTNGIVVTSAQNNTKVNQSFWTTLTSYCLRHNYSLVVIPYTYKATDDVLVRYEDMEYDISYANQLRPFLCRNKLRYGGYIVHGDLNLRPTTLNPLSGVTSLTQGLDAVFGHPQICNLPLATAKNRKAVKMLTTGACTEKNYRAQPTGIKGAFHHSLGATLVLPDGNHFQLTAKKDGSFVDRGIEYSGDEVSDSKCLSLVLGDVHVGYTCPDVMQKTYEFVENYQPETIFLHDLFDGNTINHHEEHNPFSKFGLNFASIKDELEAVVDFLLELYKRMSDFSAIYIVASNHDDFLRRWLMRADWRELDPISAKVYLELAKQTVSLGSKNTLKLAIGHLVPDNVVFLDEDESIIIAGIEHGMHGHIGANGGKGSPKTLAKHHSKSTTGHVHYASITKGNMTVGTSTVMNMGYNKGFSNWQNAHVVLWNNGKRQHFYL